MIGAEFIVAFVMAADSGSSGNVIQLILGASGIIGVTGALVAIFKLRPEMTGMAVEQTQAAAMEWYKIAQDRREEIERLEHEVETWRTRALDAEARLRGD